MCLKIIRSWICNYDRDVPSPDIVGTIDYSELLTIMIAEYGDKVPILLPDEYYQLATMESFLRFLEADNTNEYVYTGDLGFDCDNYASILSGRTSIPKWGTVPIGTVRLSTPAHAMNVFVDEHKEVWLFEPQTDDEFMSYAKMHKDYGYEAQIVWFD